MFLGSEAQIDHPHGLLMYIPIRLCECCKFVNVADQACFGQILLAKDKSFSNQKLPLQLKLTILLIWDNE